MFCLSVKEATQKISEIVLHVPLGVWDSLPHVMVLNFVSCSFFVYMFLQACLVNFFFFSWWVIKKILHGVLFSFREKKLLLKLLYWFKKFKESKTQVYECYWHFMYWQMLLEDQSWFGQSLANQNDENLERFSMQLLTNVIKPTITFLYLSHSPWVWGNSLILKSIPVSI